MFTPEEAAAVIDLAEETGDRLLKATGCRLVYPADEFYIKAGRPLPGAEFYGEFSQLENGVGLCSLLRSEFEQALAETEETPGGSRLVLATGTAAAPLLLDLTAQAQKKWPELRVQVAPIRNRFFGETIDVAGLITGGDLIDLSLIHILGFLLDDLSAVVIAAIAAKTVRALVFAALRALYERRSVHLPYVGTPLIASGLRMLSLRYRHVSTSLSQW